MPLYVGHRPTPFQRAIRNAIRTQDFLVALDGQYRIGALLQRIGRGLRAEDLTAAHVFEHLNGEGWSAGSTRLDSEVLDWGYDLTRRLAALDSAIAFVATMAKDTKALAAEQPRLVRPEVPEPLAVACGLTRLAVPMVPRAPEFGASAPVVDAHGRVSLAA
ncbi:hypothetical protein ACIRBX_25035 [Kitasatospora sp. NPDC096147]|uniref:hypothetical protein n=1 Tax=Kitasatospora sp. NPDC096147 TaxID=3364093 RepID=UPI0038179A32